MCWVGCLQRRELYRLDRYRARPGAIERRSPAVARRIAARAAGQWRNTGGTIGRSVRITTVDAPSVAARRAFHGNPYASRSAGGRSPVVARRMTASAGQAGADIGG